MNLVNEKHIEAMAQFRTRLDENGIEWEGGSDPLMIRTKFFLNESDKDPWSVICGSGSMGGDDGLLEVWNPKDDEPSGGYTIDEVMEMIEREETMPTNGSFRLPESFNMKLENPKIECIKPNRYKLMKDVIEWAAIHNKTVSISEVDEMLSVVIHSDDESEGE